MISILKKIMFKGVAPIETNIDPILKEKKPTKHGQVIKKEVCNCCGNATVTYRRKIGHSILKPLTTAWKYCVQNNKETFHVLDSQSNDYNRNTDLAKARYYGLIEKPKVIDVKSTNGVWMFTELGKRFMMDGVSLQEYFILKNGKLVGFDGELKTYSELIGKKYEKAS